MEMPPSGAKRQFLDLRATHVAGLVFPLAARTVLRVGVEVPVARQAAACPSRQLVHVVVVFVHSRSALAQPLAEIKWSVGFLA